MFFDTHAHLDDARYDEDREAVIASMKEEGISPCMTVGANMRMNRMAVQLAQAHPGYLYAAVGIHPSDSEECTDEAMEEMKRLAALPCVKAWGEIGLDYHWPEPEPARPGSSRSGSPICFRSEFPRSRFSA